MSSVSNVNNIKAAKITPTPSKINGVNCALIVIFLNENVGILLINKKAMTKVK